MTTAFTPHDYGIVLNVFLAISRSTWFEPDDAEALAIYLLHRYKKGHDEASLRALSLPFATEWFRVRDMRLHFGRQSVRSRDKSEG